MISAADNEPTATPNTFTPSATWETAEYANDAVSSAGSAGLSNRYEASISAHVVTPANGDKYVTLVAEASTTSQNITSTLVPVQPVQRLTSPKTTT